MRLGIALIGIAFFALPLRAQEAAPAAAGSAETVLASGLGQERMTVPVMIAGSGPYHFVIDTGAERTVISRELAAALGLAPGRVVRLTAITRASRVSTVIIPSLSVSPIASGPIEAPALDGDNLGAPGMLGLDALQGHALAIDFVAPRMTLRRSSKRGRAAAADEIIVRAKSRYGQLILTGARYRGRRIKVVLDTGSAVSLGNSAFRDRIGGRGRGGSKVSLLDVTGGALVADYLPVGRIEVGGIGFDNLPIAIADAAPFRHFGLANTPALLLGMDALRLFRRVEIDFANREVRFTGPGARARPPLATGPQ